MRECVIAGLRECFGDGIPERVVLERGDGRAAAGDVALNVAVVIVQGIGGC